MNAFFVKREMLFPYIHYASLYDNRFSLLSKSGHMNIFVS
jgi:hypothetical protein